MSLFGSTPPSASAPHPASVSRNSLFDDEPGLGATTATSKSSLFADDDVNAGAASPWDMPIPKKASRADLVKTLLPASDVPESYIDIFDAVIEAGDVTGSGVSLAGVNKLIESSGLSTRNQAQILELILPKNKDTGGGIRRGEFNVLLALIGLGQEREDITLDGVDERRSNLPEPRLASISRKVNSKVETPATAISAAATPSKRSNEVRPAQRRVHDMGEDSVEFPEADPWASPDLHKGHGHQEGAGSVSAADSSPARVPSRPNDLAPRTTSTFTTSSADHPSEGPDLGGSRYEAPINAGEGWSTSNPADPPMFSGPPDLSIDGGPSFRGSGGGERPHTSSHMSNRPSGAGRGVEEVVNITALPEKEGMIFFQHRNYQVSSVRRATKVVRRYSDFVWLLDCLLKRYPFRQLPLLPPKRVGVNGNHLSSDAAFIEKRRRGLVRFTNALVRHPILNQEQLVVMFLSVPTELSVWRKQATLTLQEEFTGRVLPPTLEDSLPVNLSETFATVRSGIDRSSEILINLCTLLERLCKRNTGLAADQARLASALRSLQETSGSTYAIETNDVPLLNAGLNATAKHLAISQSLLEDEARGWDGGVLEDLKRQRDGLVSMRELFRRSDSLSRDSIPQLERKIEANEGKLTALRNKPDGTIKPAEIEKVEVAIIRDKQLIVSQHARSVFIKECLRDELNFFQRTQYHVSRLHQDWSQELVKYAELQADNWRGLAEEVETMPLGE